MTELPKAGIVTLCAVPCSSHRLLSAWTMIQWKQSSALQQSCAFPIPLPISPVSVRYATLVGHPCSAKPLVPSSVNRHLEKSFTSCPLITILLPAYPFSLSPQVHVFQIHRIVASISFHLSLNRSTVALMPLVDAHHPAPLSSSGPFKMEERKRPAANDSDNTGPPLKRQATTLNGAGRSHPDADMPWQDDLEVSLILPCFPHCSLMNVLRRHLIFFVSHADLRCSRSAFRKRPSGDKCKKGSESATPWRWRTRPCARAPNSMMITLERLTLGSLRLVAVRHIHYCRNIPSLSSLS